MDGTLPTTFLASACLCLPLLASSFLYLPLPASACLCLSLPASFFLYLPLPNKWNVQGRNITKENSHQNRQTEGHYICSNLSNVPDLGVSSDAKLCHLLIL